MSSQNLKSDDKKLIQMNSKQLKLKINQFLSARTQKQPLLDIIKHFEVNLISQTNQFEQIIKIKVRLCVFFFFLIVGQQ